MKQFILTIFVLSTTYFILNISYVYAQSKIFINEFLIDPQPQSVEIFNSGSESANISDWMIDDSGGTTFYTIPKESIIFPNRCLIFSTDFNLNKTSADTVQLINNSQQLVDSFSYKSSSGSGISFLRLPDGSNNWTTESATLGFYNQTNISCLITPTQTPTSISSPTTIQVQPTPTDSTDSTDLTVSSLTPSPYSLIPVSYDNIYLSEAMVNPATGEKEWVEIYNNNDFPVSLNNWYLDDIENTGSSPKIFSLEIDKKSYAVFNLTISMFNNDGDSVRLLDFNKNLKDDFEYGKTEQGKTLGRTSFDSDDLCLQEPSKNLVNNSCINPTPTPTLTQSPIKTIILNTKSPTTKPNNFDVSIHRSINYPTEIVLKDYDNGDVLGITSNTINNNSLINLLMILSTSYSLLTIFSILFKMKLLYGKNKNFYSSPFHSS
ncbi:MAG: lamin tail domain-containing protein [Patescibacteria group bacterium]